MNKSIAEITPGKWTAKRALNEIGQEDAGNPRYIITSEASSSQRNENGCSMEFVGFTPIAEVYENDHFIGNAMAISKSPELLEVYNAACKLIGKKKGKIPPFGEMKALYDAVKAVECE